jgi:hypothetical protein
MWTVVLGLDVCRAPGLGDRSFAEYCPFGGVESWWGVLTTVGGSPSSLLAT